MKISVIIGCEGILGQQIASAKIKNPENIVVGYDLSNISRLTHERFHYVSGSVENLSEIGALNDKIRTLQEKYATGNQLNCVINSFATPDYKFDQNVIPEGLPETDWMLWGWKHYPDSDFMKQFDVNVVGIHRVLTKLYDRYQDSTNCSIVNFSSQYAKRNLDQDIFHHLGKYVFKPPAYSATKAAIQNYTEYLSQVFKNSGIRVNSIAPGVVDTGQKIEFKEEYSRSTNTGRLMNPSEIVGAVEFLTSDDSSYMNGTSLILDGGWSSR